MSGHPRIILPAPSPYGGTVEVMVTHRSPGRARRWLGGLLLRLAGKLLRLRVRIVD